MTSSDYFLDKWWSSRENRTRSKLTNEQKSFTYRLISWPLGRNDEAYFERPFTGNGEVVP